MKRLLLKSLLARIAQAVRWLIGNPVVLSIILGVALAMSVVTCRNRTQERNTAQNELRYHLQHLTRLQADSVRLEAARARAYTFADSLTRTHHATQDSIRRAVNALPAAERTKLNRSLLSRLGLL